MSSRSPSRDAWRIHPEVAAALERCAPVVALESAVITSGLPRTAVPLASLLASHSPGLSPGLTEGPVNLQLARAMQQTVRETGATPATIAVLEGQLCIGLHDDELVMLSEERCAAKASVTDLSHLMVTGGSAGTTVSATLAACAAHAGIRVFATGGIGGVHRGWQQRLDISADLRQISNTPICVVCSGAKTILDLPATLEMLEALGVPVIGYRTSHFPRFMTRGDATLPLSKRIDNVDDAARWCDHHWNTLQCAGGVLLCNPPPQEHALDAVELERAVEQAERTASQQNVSGPVRTPFLLAEIAKLTRGRSLAANLALLLDNARLAGELAVALHGLHRAKTR